MLIGRPWIMSSLNHSLWLERPRTLFGQPWSHRIPTHTHRLIRMRHILNIAVFHQRRRSGDGVANKPSKVHCKCQSCTSQAHGELSNLKQCLLKDSPQVVTACELLFSSVQFSRSVVSDSLQPHGLQHARPPCPSPIPGVYPNSCLSSQWCHPTISSSVIPFSSRLQSFPASGSFPMTQFFTSGGQSIGVSASTSVLAVNTQD